MECQANVGAILDYCSDTMLKFNSFLYSDDMPGDGPDIIYIRFAAREINSGKHLLNWSIDFRYPKHDR